MRAIALKLLQVAVVAALLLAAMTPLRAMAQVAETPQVEQLQQQPKIDPRKLLVPRKNADGTIKMTSFSESPVRWVAEKQRQYTMAMASALRAARGEAAATAAWTLLLLSFVYGVLHAAGPGHGKTVVSAWLLATENELKRGIIIAFISSMIQALTAVVLVGGVLLLVSSAAATARHVAGVMESASYAMIGVLGLYLIGTAFRQLAALRQPQASLAVAVPASSASDFATFQPLKSVHIHSTAAEAAICSECGHAHAPSPVEVRGDWSWSKAFAMSLAIGIRPCTGAIVILLLAYTLGLFTIGIAATFAMAFGTFLTVSGIAILSVYARKLALRLAGRNTRGLTAVSLSLRFAGGLAIAAFGALLFAASLTSSAGPT